MPEHSVKDEINSATSSEAISIARANSTSNPVSDEESSATEISEGHHSTESEEVAFGDDRLESVMLPNEDEKNTNRHVQTIVNIWNLFRFANGLDWFLMVIGSLLAILHGFVLPIALLVLSYIINAFSAHELSRLIANFEQTVPVDYLLHLGMSQVERGELTHYEAYPNKAGFIKFDIQNLTGGIVNCSAVYVYRLPYPYKGQFNFTIGDLVRSSDAPACFNDTSFTNYINIFLLGLSVVIIVVAFLGALQMLIFHLTSERQMRKMRLYYFRSILSQERKWHDLQTLGDIGIHLSEDIEKVHNGVGTNLSILIQYLSTFVAGILGAFYLNWEMTLILLVTTPFIVAPSAVFNQLVATFGSAEQKHYAAAGNIAEEILSAIRTVVAFGGEHNEVDRYEQHLNAAKKVGTRRGIVGGFSLCTVYFVLFSSFGVAFWYGAHIVTQQMEAGGVIVAVFFSVSIGAFYLGQSSTNFGNLLSAAVAAIPILETIDRESGINPISERGEELEQFDGGVEFKNVTFAYPSRPDVPVINEFNLSVKPGQVVAIIGPSGGGKSTTVKLLQRLYDPIVGQVLFNKKDIKSLSVKWLRSQIGTVSQEPVLFNTTIRENILFGSKTATMPDVVQAAKAANAHHFIMSLPLGYNTVVGEQGGQLSGGQKQRIAIARALVRNPKILLLDEATSALDTENEAILLETIKNVAGEKTVIVITHRLPLVKCADHVVSVEGGQVTWRGTPAELYAMKNINVDKEDDPSLAFPAGKQQPEVFRKGQTLSMRRQNASLRREKVKEQEGYGEFSIFQKILVLNRKEWWIILVGSLAAMISGAGFPIFAVLFGGVTKVFINSSRDVFSDIHPWASGFILLGVGMGAAIFVKTLCFSMSGESLTRRVRYLTFKAMLRQEISWFDSEQNTTGILVGTLSDDGRNVQAVSGNRLGWFIEGATAIVLAHIVSFRYNWILTIVLSVVVPLYLFSGWLNTRASVGFAHIRRQALQEATEIAIESVENIETVSSLGLEERIYRDYERKIKKPIRRALVLVPLSGLSQTILLVGYIIAFRFGAYQVTLDKDHLFHSTFIDILIVFAALAFTSSAIAMSASLGPDYALAKVSAKRILKILERKPNPDGYSKEGAKLDKFKGEISFNNLFFRYPNRPEVKVLQDVDIVVKPGQTLAIVGVSGSGKTTLFSLIERFYEPSSGTVALDGVGYQYLNIRWLRSQIGVVSQEPVLFDLSIADNIRYGANGKEVSDSDIEAAAKAANIHDFITTLPNGYATNVGARGTQLSGGQKQRIAIARALLHDPTILLLDEATSALDDVNECIVQAALDKAMKGRTSVVISHRMSTIANADIIAVINGGKVTEIGSHEELMEKGGDYFRMVHMQSI